MAHKIMADLKVKIYNEEGNIVGEESLDPKIFGLTINTSLLHQAVTAYQANTRVTLAHTKDRGEVSGGGKKPWRQKGTGRARHGSTRSPIWVGGGVTFGPTSDRNFKEKINKKMKRKALLMSLSDKASLNHIVVLDSFVMPEHKTKRMVTLFKKLPVTGSLLFVLPEVDPVISKSTGNLSKVRTTTVSSLNVFDVIKAGTLLTTSAGIKKMNEQFSRGARIGIKIK